MSRHIHGERGASALLVAASMLFIIGAAALAVDVSSFYQSARTDQTTADLACLAGAAELPDTAAALSMAADFAELNWPSIAGGTRTVLSATSSELRSGLNSMVFEAGYAGQSDQMKVTVYETADTEFAQVLGAQSVQVVQEAICEGGLKVNGSGLLPFGAITGGWTGPLQISPPCGPSNGNCGALSIPRSDVSGAGPTLIRNIAEGPDRLLAPSLGSAAAAASCSAVGAGGTCSIISTDTGVSAAHLGEGFFDRLNNDPGASCMFSYQGGTLNCDTPAQVLGGAWTPLMTQFPTQPGWWDTSLYGAYNAANTTRHFWYDGVVAKCDSSRIGGVPVISANLDWDLGDASTGWPNGKKDVKVVALLDVVLEEPYDAGDFQGNKNLKTAGASVVWYGPNAACSDGRPIGVLNGVSPTSGSVTVKLIAG